MTEYQRVLQARATSLFGGIPVSEFERAIDWYTRLFNAPPAFFPNEREAVWALAEGVWLYIIVDAARAGGAIQTIMCDGLDQVLSDIAERGLLPAAEERPGEGARKVMFRDPDGNEIGIGSIPSG